MSSEVLLVQPSAVSPTKRIVGELLRSREIAVGAVLVVVIALTTLKSPDFLFSSNGWRDLLLTPSLLLLLAVGQAVVIITRNVDLSVGSTLGPLYIYRGIFLSWAGSSRINASDMPSSFLDLGTKQILTIPVLTIIGLVVLGLVGYYLYTARGGRELYAIGSDPDAAVLYGLPVRRRVIAAFVLCGALAGLAGVVYTARYGTVSS